MKSEMNTPLTLEEGLKKIEDAIARKRLISDAQCVTPFTTAENMLIYELIYKFFEFLDRFYAPRKGLLLLADAPKHYYGNQVCERLYGKIQEAAISLIIEDREGKDIDRNLLKAVLCLFIGLGGKGTTNYYEKFEQIMLAETAAYYSELSMEWWFWRDSLTSYLRKVDWCLVQEEARAEVYPCKTTKTKLLEVMKYILLERNAKRWAQKQKANGVAAEDQELLSKYASLSLDIGSSASVATATDH
ncbi:hypothetical protein GH714_025793 [Hevea brasiliensis]|uniref:Cullin N-terminal domain-containing protein n=1 Tax=Hevea brasiliensis TaxID=3981 RepID=A0A6A6M0N2_HEVBR|nr:hypothetical protein GH714_025793 [Hevea brasiliensis]